ncbi:MAG: peptidase S41 [Mariniphaga sp.]|nr:peptidase S41 [Mariniphaga sp.]
MKKKYTIIIMLFIAMIAKSQVPNTLTRQDKIFGLSKIWQEVNYNFIYLERIDRVKWDSTYRVMIKTVQETKNDYEYYRELQKFCAFLNDGHTFILLPKSIDSLLYTDMFGAYRIRLKNIGDKAIITHINESKKGELPIGSEIVEVNGLLTEEYINQFVAPYISSSTEYVLKDEGVEKLLMGLKGDEYRIKINTPDGKSKTITLIHDFTAEKEVYPPIQDKQLLDFRWYDNQFAYVALNSFRDPKIIELFLEKLPELQKAKGLIVDLRCNKGGNTRNGTGILQYLTNDTILYGAKSETRNHIPSFKAWGRYANPSDTSAWSKKSFLMSQDRYYYPFDYYPANFKPSNQKINIPTVLLIGHKTFSAAEDFLIFADNQKHMIKMGEASHGSTGEPLMFELPGGGFALVCTIKSTFPDGREFVGYGVKPDIEVKPTLNDFIQNNDPVLNSALTYLNQDSKP